jgi:beta-lactamase regulating signal transducer with metallopeptidase domain
MFRFVIYLTESSICLILFALAYRIYISKLTHFSLSRIYILSSLILSFVIPFIIIPIKSIPKFVSFNRAFLFLESQTSPLVPESIAVNNISNNPGIEVFQYSLILFLIIYCIGFIYKAHQLFNNLKIIYYFSKQNPKEKERKYQIVSIKNEMPAFSFFNYIFINRSFKNLSERDFEQIKTHEFIHSNHLHTIDILLFELASIVIWFNPIIYYFKNAIQEIHEYTVDEKIAGNGYGLKEYALLLIKLASENKELNLSANFTGKQIKNRINMITKQKSSALQKLTFLVILPITAALLFSFSYVKNPEIDNEKQNINSENSPTKIGEIKWEGNKIYPVDTLNKLFGLKTGDPYSYKDINYRLLEGNLATFYFDNGYVFYNAELYEKKQQDGSIALRIIIYEGRRGIIGKISVKGNTKVPSDDILQKITIKSGDMFTKREIVKSVKAIASMGKFVPTEIVPTPIPNWENSTIEFASVDLVFEVTEKSK